MRRKDREITSYDKMLEIMQSCDCCRIGLKDKDSVYILPLNFEKYSVYPDKTHIDPVVWKQSVLKNESVYISNNLLDKTSSSSALLKDILFSFALFLSQYSSFLTR